MISSRRPDRFLPAAFLFALLLFCQSQFTAAYEWPQEIEGDEATIVIYQPQPDAIEGNILKARAAMAIELKDGSDPIFGAMWIAATLETDRGNDSATVSNIKVEKVTWPDSKDTSEQRFTQLMESALVDTILEQKLSDLTSALAASEKAQESLENLNNDPPKIIMENQLALLLLYDGKPRFKAVENSSYERALNAPMAVAKDTKTKTFYLAGGGIWYSASDALGPWKQTSNPPADLVAMIPKTDDPVPTTIPLIVTATEPTELISTQGKPKWGTLQGGKLLYVENTETPWIRDLASGNMYVQLSGRWYRAKSEDGPWTFVRSDKLPAAFSEIPPASDIGGVRSSVAGTDEAQEAIADAQIPQTTAIKRSEASLTVEYDGEPKFESIKGTDVAYAVNTGGQVLRIDGVFYAADNGVWFTASAAKGPWTVADSIPDKQIAEIPASSPVYNTTYVKVYDSTPEVVYVGYTPGYMWSFPYYGVPVYGTGYYYPPYWGAYYYPRAPTWGLNVGYNPWTGWNFGVSWGGPFLRVGVAWGGGWGGVYRPWRCCGGFYGGGYRHNDIHIKTGDINIGNNVNIGNRRNDIKSTRKNRDKTNNIYNHSNNKHRNADRTSAQASMKKARSNSKRSNNLYADRNGQVARHNGKDWEVRKDNSWKKTGADRVSTEVVRPSKTAKDASSRVGSMDQPKRDSMNNASSRVGSMDRPNHNSMNRGAAQQRPQFNHQRMNREMQGRQRSNTRRRR